MSRISIRMVILAILILVLIRFLGPVYQFSAHQGELPMWPIGWTHLPEEAAPERQNVLNPDYESAGQQALKIMHQHRERIGAPAVSAAVAVDGEQVWAGAVGWADIEQRTPVTPETRFRIGSTSKALTATALARLVDQRVIDLDTPLENYIEPLPNPDWAPITARQLASHMAGIPHYGENTDWRGLYRTVALQTQYRDIRDAVALFDGSELLFEPGTDFEYSSLGTVLLGALMSHAADQPFRALMNELVFQPLGMESTIAAPKKAPEDSLLATFYYRDLDRDGDRYREWRPVDLSHRLPGGGFASTPSDLVRLGAAQLDDGFIAPATRTEFWKPQILANGEVNEQGYAIGWRWREWEIEGAGVVRNANHGGVSRGAQCWLLVFPDQNMAIAFVINARTDGFHEFGHRLYEELFRAFALNSS